MTTITLALENNQLHYVYNCGTVKKACKKLADDKMVTMTLRLRQLDCQSRITNEYIDV
jgi:hypothetical protein